MTKPMLAVVGFMLMEKGRLPLRANLSDPGIRKHEGAVRQPDGSIKFEAQSSPIYGHDLDRHTSGLSYGGPSHSSDQVARLCPGFATPPVKATSMFSTKALPSCRWRINQGRNR
ncbi:hypothetical protein AAFG07_34215 [Bradyrhizobium sp. B097]|uniref:hypothetical protein n=1 Tax=Bradyrhizobium sp. B097 TaxID=3140244 RepID=UPI003183845B